jgi:hypothetical protein
VARGRELRNNVTADETGAAGNEHPLGHAPMPIIGPLRLRRSPLSLGRTPLMAR